MAKRLLRNLSSIVIVVMFGVVGCSNSATEDNINEPPLIFPLVTPFIYDGDLYEYRPDLRKTFRLVEFEESKVAFLDTDEVSSIGDFNERSVEFQDATPDHVAFAQNNELLLYQFQTRRTHQLYNFAGPLNPNGEEQICKLRPSTIFDTNSFRNASEIRKEALAIFVEATPSSDLCDTSTDKRYYRILIREATDTYSIRQEEEIERDGELVTEITTTAFPNLIGEKSVATQSLMFSSSPIRTPSRTEEAFGYYGFDDSGSLSFHRIFIESLEDIEQLWELNNSSFAIQASYAETVPEKLSAFPSEFRAPISVILGDNLYLENGWDLISLRTEDLFEADNTAQRQASSSTPVIQRTPPVDNTYEPINLLVSDASSTLLSLIDSSIFDISTASNTVSSVAINTSQTDTISLTTAGQSPVIIKRFPDSTSSVVTLNGNVEQTLRPRIAEVTRMFMVADLPYTLVNTADTITDSWTATLHTAASFSPPQENSLFVSVLDERSYFDHDEGPTETIYVLHSEVQANSTGTPALSNPSLYSLDILASPPIANTLARIPQSIADDPENKIRIMSDEYGLAELATVDEFGNVSMKLYYFNPINTIESPGLPPLMEEIPLPPECLQIDPDTQTVRCEL